MPSSVAVNEKSPFCNLSSLTILLPEGDVIYRQLVSLFDKERESKYPKLDIMVSFCARAREECDGHFIIPMKVLEKTF